MKNILNDQTIELACPHCGHKLKERIGKLKTNAKLICTKCKVGFSIDANDLRREVTKVEKSHAQLLAALGKLGK